jgi:Cell division protein CrgA
MPESRVRRTAPFTAPPTKSVKNRPNPRWWAPVMVGLMVLGLAYVVVFYLTNYTYPIPPLHSWNILVGFAIMMVGFGMTTRWR